uniref:Uncharacterized protein n=1 Tax=Romanomermis culicivorax TaxID=13658 RepID=A0A915IGN4_ROMCU
MKLDFSQLNCTHEQCLADCNSKGRWTPWSPCTPTFIGNKRVYSRQITKSCLSQEVDKNCTPTDTMRGIGQFQVTTTTESTTISDDYGADTHSTLSTIRTTTFSTTVTTEAPAFSVFGLNAAVILAIVAGVTLVLIIIGGAVFIVATRERRRLAAGRFKIMLVPAKTTPLMKTLGQQAGGPVSLQRSKKSSKTVGSTKSSQQSSKQSAIDGEDRLPNYKPQQLKALKTLPSIQDRTQKILTLPRTPLGQNKDASKKKSNKKTTRLKTAPNRRP